MYRRFEDETAADVLGRSGLVKSVSVGCMLCATGLGAFAVFGQGGITALRGGNVQPAMFAGEANVTAPIEPNNAGGGETMTHLIMVGAGVVAVALLMFGVVLPCLLNHTVKIFVEALDKFIVGSDVTMGRIEVSVLRRAFVMYDFKLLNPGNKYKSDCVCKLRRCEGGVALKSLICSLGKRVELRYLKVDGVELNAEFVGLSSNVNDVNELMMGVERDEKGNITKEAMVFDTVYVCHNTSIDNIEVSVTLPMNIPLYNGGKVSTIPNVHSDRKFESTPAELMQFVMALVLDSAKEVTGSAGKMVSCGAAAVATGVLTNATMAGNSMMDSFHALESKVR